MTECLESDVLTSPLYITAEVAEPPKIPSLSMSTVTDEWLAFFPKLILGLLIGTMAVLGGIFYSGLLNKPPPLVSC